MLNLFSQCSVWFFPNAFFRCEISATTTEFFKPNRIVIFSSGFIFILFLDRGSSMKPLLHPLLSSSKMISFIVFEFSQKKHKLQNLLIHNGN